jgi:hypothetical protein
MQQPLNALISGDDGACQNRQNDRNACQVLDAAIPEGKSLAWPFPCKPERNGQRNRRGGITKIVNCVGKQCYATRYENDSKLEYSSDS